MAALGLTTSTTVPVASFAAMVVAAVVIGNLIALLPGWSAARTAASCHPRGPRLVSWAPGGAGDDTGITARVGCPTSLRPQPAGGVPDRRLRGVPIDSHGRAMTVSAVSCFHRAIRTSAVAWAGRP